MSQDHERRAIESINRELSRRGEPKMRQSERDELRGYSEFSHHAVHAPDDPASIDDCVETVLRELRPVAKMESVVVRQSMSEHLQALTLALTSTTIAAARGTWPGDSTTSLAKAVQSFRTEVLEATFPMKVSEVRPWLEALDEDADSHALAIPLENGYSAVVGYSPGGVMERLDALADELSAVFRWSGTADGVAFVLCDAVPLVHPVKVSVTGDRFVTMTLHVDVSPEEAAEAYRVARRRFFPTRPKSIPPRTLRALAFAAGRRSSRTWRELRAEWNRRHPEPGERYATDQSFRQAVVDTWPTLY